MKRFLLTVIISSLFKLATAAVITWDGGGGDGQWNTAANWAGDVIPGAGDDVVLDNTVVLTNYTISLPAGAVTVTILSLTITPTGANVITLVLPATNTANPGLSITGPGDALILNTGSVLRNSSGAAAGSGVSIANTFRINNGGHYIHNTARSQTPILDQLSGVPGTETGEFEFDDPTGGTTLSLTNRIFGTLTLSAAASAGAATYIASGANPCTVRGNFNIKQGVTFSISFSANFIIQQNYDQAISSTFNIQSAGNNNVVQVAGNLSSQGTITESGSGLPVLEMNGTGLQNVGFAVTGSIINNVTFRVNKSAGNVFLLLPLTLPYNLTLTSGRITAFSLLTMIDDATVTGGSAASFVDGAMKKIGNDNFVFPVGKGSIYAPIGIVNVSGQAISDEFTAEYIRTNPQSVHGTATQTGTDHVSFVEYWTLNHGVGTAIKKISLAVNTTSFCKVLANTFVSRWGGTFWTNESSTNGGVTSIPPFETGTITSVNNLSAFGDITLITDLPFSVNPLPIDLITFNAAKNNSSAILTWELSACCSRDARFELQKSTDGTHFSALIAVPGSETNRFYNAADNRLQKGINYYRLKMIDIDRKISYSKTVAIIHERKDILITSLAPNPVQDNAVITISSAQQSSVLFTVYDLSGREIKRWRSAITEGNTNVSMDTDGLSKGIYYVLASSPDSRAVFRFIKQ